MKIKFEIEVFIVKEIDLGLVWFGIVGKMELYKFIIF